VHESKFFGLWGAGKAVEVYPDSMWMGYTTEYRDSRWKFVRIRCTRYVDAGGVNVGGRGAGEGRRRLE